MRDRMKAGIVLLATLIAGCASSGPAPERASAAPSARATPEASSDVVCTVVKPLGTHLAQRKCYSRESIEARRQQERDNMMLTNRGILSGTHAPGGN